MVQLDFNLRYMKNHERFSDLNPKIVEAFFNYHRENPRVFMLFCKYAKELRNAGRKNYGIGSIAERIRWHMAVETRGDDFKLNNNYRSCYARLLMITNPEFEGFFKIRRSPGTVPILKNECGAV